MTDRRELAVVTGGASGIGFALACRLGDRGCSLVLIDKNVAELDAASSTLREAGVDVATLEGDVRDPASMTALAQTVADQHGSVDVLCANAGVSGPGMDLVWASRPDDWERVFGVNVFGTVNTLRAFVPAMVADARGQVLVTGSLTSFMTDQVGAVMYKSSKHALFAIVDSVRVQLQTIGSPVKIQFLAPGGVMTRIGEHEATEAQRLRGAGAASPPHQAIVQALQLDVRGEVLGPDAVAAIAVDALGSDDFVIFTHSDSAERVSLSWDDLVSTLSTFSRD